MALARVQATPIGFTNLTNTLTLTFPGTPVVGNAVIVSVLWNGSPSLLTAATVTDNRGHTYELVVGRVESVSRQAAIFACVALTATGSPFTITIAVTGSTFSLTASAIEVGGFTGGALRVDATVSNSSTPGSTTATTGTTPSLRTTAGGAIVVAAVMSQLAQTSITVDATTPTWTQEFERLTGTNPCVGEGDSRVLAAPLSTTQAATWTLAQSSVWAAVLAVFGSADALPLDSRVTHAPIELLSAPVLPAVRVTQTVVEILGPTTASLVVVPNVVGLTLAAATTALTAVGLTVGTVTGDPAGLVTASVPVAGTFVASGTAVALTLVLPVAASVRVTQDVVEVLGQSAPLATTRTTQLAVEVFETQPARARTTQLAAEVWLPLMIPIRTTQIAVEYLRHDPGRVRVSQEVVEVFIQHHPRRLLRRLRRAPHVHAEHRRITYARFALDLQRGVGALMGQGATPVVTLRVSRDGGRTWGEPVTMRAGTLGAYTTRVLARRLGHARDAVFEVTVSDPVAWSLVQAWLDLEPGNS